MATISVKVYSNCRFGDIEGNGYSVEGDIEGNGYSVEVWSDCPTNVCR